MLNTTVNFIQSLIVRPVYAQDTGSIYGLVDVAGRAINILVLASGAIFVVFVIFTAFKFATSQGDAKAVQGAKESLTMAVLGLLVVLGIFAINSIVVGILGAGDEYGTPTGIFDNIKSGVCELLDYAGVDEDSCSSSGGGSGGGPHDLE
jgi:hypothetical protein